MAKEWAIKISEFICHWNLILACWAYQESIEACLRNANWQVDGNLPIVTLDLLWKKKSVKHFCSVFLSFLMHT